MAPSHRSPCDTENPSSSPCVFTRRAPSSSLVRSPFSDRGDNFPVAGLRMGSMRAPKAYRYL